jgi:hypothetical protein
MRVDKNSICDSIKKARPQDLVLVTTNQSDKDSKKNALAEIEKFISKGNFDVVVVKRF